MGQAIARANRPAAAPAADATAPDIPTRPAARQALLRQQLQALTDLQPCHLHAGSVPALAAAHGAWLYRLPAPGAVAEPLYNCVMYALDLVGRFEPLLQRIQGLDFRYLADTAFLQQALAQGVIRGELRRAQARCGDLVVYRGADGLARHVAKYLGDGRCASKWGPGGLYAHGLWDLPADLGDSARFFHAPRPEQVLALLARQEPGLRLTDRPAHAGNSPAHHWPSRPGRPTLWSLPAAQAHRT